MADPQSRNHSGFVRIDVANSPTEAKIVAGVLLDAGIPVLVNDTPLQDGVAISQALMNIVGTEVKVPEDRVDEAYQVLANAKKTAAERLRASVGTRTTLATLATTAQRKGSRISRGTVVMSCLALSFSILWLAERDKVLALSVPDPQRYYRWDAQGSFHIWRHNNKLAFHRSDANQNNVSESWKSYNRQGTLLSEATDADEDGMPERVHLYAPNGEVVSTWHDADQDGFLETWVEFFADKSQVKWIDQDLDGHYELRQYLDPAGKLLFTEEDRGAQGFERR